MIVVLGRLGGPHVLAPRIALAVAAAGGEVEVVGTAPEGSEADEALLELARHGIRHAAVLRVPADAAAADPAGAPRAALRLDAPDVQLGLSYLVEYSVLVIAEPLDAAAEAVALDAAAYHEAAVFAVVPRGATVTRRTDEAGEVVEAPDGDVDAWARSFARRVVATDPRPGAAIIPRPTGRATR